MIRQCCVCHANGSAVAMEPTTLPGDWRCRDQVGCRRRVRGTVQSVPLAAELNEESADSHRKADDLHRLATEVTELARIARDFGRKR